MNPITRLVSDVAAGRLFRAAEVFEVDDPSPGFRVVRFGGEALRGVTWIPGQKIQLRLEGFTTRTYTPMSWDAERGEMAVLAFVHGSGPGSALVGDLSVGWRGQFFGPRGSIDLTKVAGEPLLVGDETSFGLAAAWPTAVGRPARGCFEAQDPAAARGVLEQVGVEGAEVVAAPDAPSANRAADGPNANRNAGGDGGLVALVDAAVLADPNVHLVLTGRAQSIRRVRAALKSSGAHTGPVTVKAYWDENRAGLD